MSFSDEILMAYADGELDETTRHAIEDAMRQDASLARRVAQHKALRADVFAAFSPAADKVAPPRLVRPLHQAQVVSLESVRARREAVQQAARKASRARHWSWPEWSALAAVLVVGVLVGRFGLAAWQLDGSRGDTVASHDGVLVAHGRLARALEQQLAGAGVVGSVKIGASFIASDGGYCRSFMTGSGGQELAGLACKLGADWRIPMVLQNTRASVQGQYRLASSDMPASVLELVDQRITGQPLDAKGEMEAVQKGWQR